MKVEIFGSQAADTASYFSDMDICIDGFPKSFVPVLVAELKQIAGNVRYIANAKVPIIEGVYQRCNIDFDISFIKTS